MTYREAPARRVRAPRPWPASIEADLVEGERPFLPRVVFPLDYSDLSFTSWSSIVAWYDALEPSERAAVRPGLEARLEAWPDLVRRPLTTPSFFDRLLGRGAPHHELVTAYPMHFTRDHPALPPCEVPISALPRVEGVTSAYLGDDLSTNSHEFYLGIRRGAFPQLRHVVNESYDDFFLERLTEAEGLTLRFLALAEPAKGGPSNSRQAIREALARLKRSDAIEELWLESMYVDDVDLVLAFPEGLPALRRLEIRGIGAGWGTEHSPSRLARTPALVERLTKLALRRYLSAQATGDVLAALGPTLVQFALTVTSEMVRAFDSRPPPRSLTHLELDGGAAASYSRLDRSTLEVLIASGWLDGLRLLALDSWQDLRGDDLRLLLEGPALAPTLSVLSVHCVERMTPELYRDLFDGLQLDRLRLRARAHRNYGGAEAVFEGGAYRVRDEGWWLIVDRV